MSPYKYLNHKDSVHQMAKRELLFNEELTPLYGDLIKIPPHSLFWRAYDSTFPAVSDRPTYYTSKEIANEFIYSEKDKLGSFMNTRHLRLIDIRYLKVIIRQLLDDIKMKAEYETTTKNSNTPQLTADDIDIMHITASFGLYSLHHQIIILKQLFQERTKTMDSFKNLVAYYNQESYPIVEQQGFRIGETELDAHTMYFLQHFFSEFADGFISPCLLSPYHIEKEGTMPPEMIIFNPKASGIIVAPTPKEVLEKCPIEYIIGKDRPHIILESGNFKTNIYGPKETESKKSGSLITNEHSLNILERKIIEGDPKILTLCHMGISCAKRWAKNRVKLFQSEPPVPSTPLSIFKK